MSSRVTRWCCCWPRLNTTRPSSTGRRPSIPIEKRSGTCPSDVGCISAWVHRRAGRCQCNDRNDPRRLALVVGKSRILLRLLRVLLVALGTLQFGGMHVHDVVANLDPSV